MNLLQANGVKSNYPQTKNKYLPTFPVGKISLSQIGKSYTFISASSIIARQSKRLRELKTGSNLL